MSDQDIIPVGEGKMERVAVPTWPDLEPLVEEFVDMRDYAESSVYQVRFIIKRFIDWAAKAHASNPLQFRQHMMVEKKVKRSTIATQFSILRMFWEFLVYKGVVTHNPFRMVTVRHGTEALHRTLSDGEVGRLLLALKDADTRQGAVINLMLRTGLRVQAVRLANIEDIDTSTEPARLWVYHKGHRERDMFVLLYPGVMAPLEDWLGHRPASSDPALFVSHKRPFKRLSYHTFYNDIQRVFQAAGLTGYSPHSLRHTAITLARKHGATLDGVREMAGHSDPRTTLHYDHSIQRWKNPPEQVLDEILKGEEDGERNVRNVWDSVRPT